MENNLNNELKNLVLAFSNLEYNEQKEEIENKLKTLINVMYNVNSSQEILLASLDEIKKEKDLSTIFMLCCSLEEEIAKTLEKILQ